ncbi:MAG: hypothetical protein JXB07_06825 [Anaerolineae bacterium]|nr:hypothetical protein [Anaerolineae bacterium]
MINSLLVRLGPLINQSLSATVVIISGSFFLYSLARGFRNRVARTFSALLFFVMVTYIGDLGVSYTDSLSVAAMWMQFQWLGIAFAPAAYVHLSDAILTLTGLPSRGRRRWSARFLYVLAALFLLLVLTTDWIVRNPVADPAPHFSAGPGFSIFFAYFVGAVATSMWFVIRARRRSLTDISRRRMTYLLIPYTAPALAVFPFLLVSGQAVFSPTVFYAILILFDALLVVMLTFMAYPLAFFGSPLPDRLIKAQMLQYLLRGPVVAIAALGVIIWTPKAGAVLGLSGDEAMPMLTVVAILLLQWAITLARPYLERRLIYIGDHAEMRRIQELENRLLTNADFHQLLDSILTSLCDYLRVESAFVASISGNGPRLERAVGLDTGFHAELEHDQDLSTEAINGTLPVPNDITSSGDVLLWHGFWLIPLHVSVNQEPGYGLVGLLGVAAPNPDGEELDDEHWSVLMALASRCAEVLQDRRLQIEVFAKIEGLLPEMGESRRLHGVARYGGVDIFTTPTEERLAGPDFAQRIKDALTHYWGGPRLTDNKLISLSVVRRMMSEHDGNAQRAMRAVLQQAIESLRPEGQRSMTTAEWILYNILEMRFIQGRKVRDVAMRLAMSESDLYRKQRVAIEAVAEIVMKMEQSTNGADQDPSTSKNTIST